VKSVYDQDYDYRLSHVKEELDNSQLSKSSAMAEAVMNSQASVLILRPLMPDSESHASTCVSSMLRPSNTHIPYNEDRAQQSHGMTPVLLHPIGTSNSAQVYY